MELPQQFMAYLILGNQISGIDMGFNLYYTKVSSDLRSIHLSLNNGTFYFSPINFVFPLITLQFPKSLCNSLIISNYVICIQVVNDFVVLVREGLDVW